MGTSTKAAVYDCFGSRVRLGENLILGGFGCQRGGAAPASPPEVTHPLKSGRVPDGLEDLLDRPEDQVNAWARRVQGADGVPSGRSGYA